MHSKNGELCCLQTQCCEFGIQLSACFLSFKTAICYGYTYLLVFSEERISIQAQKNPYVDIFAEKIRPLDVKLKNQVDKLVRAAARNEVRSAGGADPLQFRPNPEALVDKVCGKVVV